MAASHCACVWHPSTTAIPWQASNCYGTVPAGRYIRVLCIINYLVSPVYRRQKSCFVYFLSWFDVLWVPTVLCPSARCLARFNACLYRCMVFPRLWPVLLVCKPILISWPNDLIVCCLFSPHTRLGLSAYFSVIISWFVCSSLQC